MPRSRPVVSFAVLALLPAAPLVAQVDPRPPRAAIADGARSPAARMEAWRAQQPEWGAAHGRLLAWLVARQDETGRVPAGAAPERLTDVAATAATLLALGSGGSTMREGPHRAAVKKATIWLKEQQREDGWFCAPDAASAPLVQGLAAAALAQTFVASQYQLLRPIAANGLRALAPYAGDRAGAEPVALALATLGARCVPDDGDALANAALPALAKLLRAQGVAATAAGAFPFEGPSGATPELTTFAVALACRGTSALPVDDPVLQRVAGRFASLPARFGGNGELLDGLVLLCACDLAADLGGEPWRTMVWQVEHRVLPRLAPSTGADAGVGANGTASSITFACGPAVLRSETAETALAALALAVPWYRIGR